MAFQSLNGYTLSIWRTVQQSIVYATEKLDPSDRPYSLQLAKNLALTFKNARDALDAYLLSQSFSSAYNDLESVVGLPIDISDNAAYILSSRLTTLRSSAIALQAILPAVSTPNSAFPAGNPAIPPCDLTSFLMNFNYETAPSFDDSSGIGSFVIGTSPIGGGGSLDISDLLTTANDAAAAWFDIGNAMTSQGISYTGSTLDSVRLMGFASLGAYNAIADLDLNLAYDAGMAWNQLVAAPSCLRYASQYTSDPTQEFFQDLAVLRLIVSRCFKQFNLTALALSQQPPSSVSLATVQVGDTLPKIAARELGNFELWPNIAALNNLSPPYIAPVKGTGVAAPGQKLYMPSVTGASISNPPKAAASYESNFLGRDVYYGPLNQEIPSWTGDFNQISGYQNLSFSLGRRLQTTLGSLMFHPDFGSRLPPEVGSVVDPILLGYLNAYAESALLSDPRVSSVPSVIVQPGSNYSVSLKATVVPQGFNSPETTVNEVIGVGT